MVRNSSFEILRFLCMWMIVFYHFHLHALANISQDVLFKAMQIPTAIAVPCFVLISGWFGINASYKGFCRLFVKTGFYSLLILLIALLLDYFFSWAKPVSAKEILGGIFFISRTNNLWFIRSYIILYLLSPFINRMLSGQTITQRCQLLYTLSIITIYISLMAFPNSDVGHPLIFVLLYSIGKTLKEYDKQIKTRFSLKSNLFWYVIISIFSVLLYCLLYDNHYLEVLSWQLMTHNNSPFIIITAILLFLLFTRFSVKSSIVNKWASSIFTIYLISENSLVNVYIYDSVIYIYQHFSLLITYIFLIVYAIGIMFFALCIDKITIPIQVKIEDITLSILQKLTRKSVCILENLIK